MQRHSGSWAWIIAGASVLSAAAAAQAQCVETTQRIVDPFISAIQQTGTSVAVRGSIAIVGMPDDARQGQQSGAILVCRKFSGTWSIGAIATSFNDSFDRFGTSVAIDSGPTGTWVAVGAPGTSNGAGLVYVFRLNGASPTLHGAFRPSDIGLVSGFGERVAIWADGPQPRVAGSAPAFASDSGAVATALINPAGGLTVEPTLFPPQTSGDRQIAGASLALVGELLAIGAPDRTVGALDNAGAVHLYRFNQGWTYGGVLQSSTPAANARFGRGLSIKPGVMAVGAPSTAARGSVEIFEFDALGTPQFRQRLELTGGLPVDSFGAAVALSDDGRGLLVGAPRLSSVGATQVGAAEYFRRIGPAFQSSDVVVGSPIVQFGRFGESVAWSEGTAVIGEPGGLNGVGGIATGAATFLDVFPPIGVTASPANASGACGSALVFTADAVSSTAVSYQWLFNGQPLVDSVAFQGVTTPTLTVTSAGPPFVGGYQLRFTSACGAVLTSAPATLALTPACAGDANSSGSVNFSDITTVLSNFGAACP